MTMLNNLCDVCHKNPAIGVASTSIPFSCAFCAQCAQAGAEPEWILVYHLWAVDQDASRICGGIRTYRDGQYVDFHDWAYLYGGLGLE